VNREIATLSDLKNDVISDLTALQQAGQGRLHTNHTRMLLQKLISGKETLAHEDGDTHQATRYDTEVVATIYLSKSIFSGRMDE